MNTLQKDYNDICERYLRAFDEKHDLALFESDFKDCWIGGQVGSIADINDMYLNFDDIRYDIDNNIPAGKIFDWYWNSVDHAEMKVKYMNFESYCKGAQDPVPEKEMKRIKELRKKLDETYKEFLDSIKQYKDKNVAELF